MPDSGKRDLGAIPVAIVRDVIRDEIERPAQLAQYDASLDATLVIVAHSRPGLRKRIPDGGRVKIVHIEPTPSLRAWRVVA